MSGLRFELVASERELGAVASSFGAESDVALDTEFVFERTFWPRPGLVQLATRSEIALVDVIAIRDLAPLGDLLRSPSATKIVHSGSGDALVLDRLTGDRPAPIFDTQIAAAFAGLGSSLSYGALVEALTGTKLDKHETRTDWTRRPLSPEQLRYAAEDVADLVAIAAELRARLAALGRLGWVEEESEASIATDPERERPENAWRRLRGIERLPARVRAVARELARWREDQARARDLPRGFVLADATLTALARKGTLEPAEAKKLPGFEPRRHAGFVEAWRLALAEAVAAAEVAPSEPERKRSLPADEFDRIDRAIATAVETKATELALPPELLLSRRQREALIARREADAPLSSGLRGFRRELLGPALDALS